MCKKIFVAAPFNGTEVEKEERVKNLSEYCVKLFNQGDSPISALLMGLSFAKYGNLPTDTETWKIFSETLLKGCDELHVLMLDGWDKSTGVSIEIAKANNMGIEIKYINPNKKLFNYKCKKCGSTYTDLKSPLSFNDCQTIQPSTGKCDGFLVETK
jgi:hypothetical protein